METPSDQKRQADLIGRRSVEWRGLIDEFDTLRAAFLRSHGLFGEADRTLECTWTKRGGAVLLGWIPKLDFLFVRWEEGSQRIKVELVDESRGRRAHFICPISNQRCRDLFLVDGQLGSRIALRLRYRSSTLTSLQRKVWTRQNGGTLPP